MVTVLYIEINVFALSILFVIFMSMQYRASGYLIDKKLFLALLGLNALSLVLSSILFIVDGKSGAIAREVNLILNAIGYILTSITLILWSLYARYQVCSDEKSTKKILMPLIIPAFINAVLAILSYFKTS